MALHSTAATSSKPPGIFLSSAKESQVVTIKGRIQPPPLPFKATPSRGVRIPSQSGLVTLKDGGWITQDVNSRGQEAEGHHRILPTTLGTSLDLSF